MGGVGCYRHCCGCRDDGGDARDGVPVPDGGMGVTKRAADCAMGGSAHRVLRGCATMNPGLS